MYSVEHDAQPEVFRNAFSGIISAGFVEQYQWKSSISNLKDADIKEIAEIFVDKRYAGKTVEEMEEAQQVTIFLVPRDDLSVLPQKDTILKYLTKHGYKALECQPCDMFPFTKHCEAIVALQRN